MISDKVRQGIASRMATEITMLACILMTDGAEWKLHNRFKGSRIIKRHTLGPSASILVLMFMLFFAVPAFAVGTSNSGIEKNITLITGDTVVVHNISGKITYSILPYKTGISRSYQIIQSSKSTYFIP